MKKVLFMLIAASLTFISCQKEDSVSSQDLQKGRKVKDQVYAVSLATTFVQNWTAEDNVISIDSAKAAVRNAIQGKDIFWSVRADETMLPQVNIHISVWNEPTDTTGGFWSAIGNCDPYIYAPGGVGAIFSGINEPRFYRAAFMDKQFNWHYSSAYQVN